MRLKLYTSNKADSQGRYQVRLSISMLGKRHITSLGYSLTKEEFDNVKAEFFKDGELTNNKHIHHADIIYLLQKIENAFEWEQTKITRKEITIDDVDFGAIINKSKGREVKPKNDLTPSVVFLDFMIEESKKKDLSKGTIAHLNSVHKTFVAFAKKKTLNEIATKEFIDSWVQYNVDRGLNNVSVKNYVNYLIWFLKWCFRKGYCGDDFMRFHFDLKIKSNQEKTIVFLTFDEIKRLEELELKGYAEITRDAFVFQCYTGLRISDVRKIRREDFNDGLLTVHIQKTDTFLVNRLNNHALRIITKYLEKSKDIVFPCPILYTMEYNLKRICKMAGIDEPVHVVDYRNHKKVERIVPKWQLITTHVGRKSFVVNSLDLGLTATQVIAYTGHSSIQAMQPYISISNKKKDSAMDVWNNIDDL